MAVARTALVRRLVAFGRVLRDAGLEVGPGRLENAARALAAGDLSRRADVYWALRCTLVSRHEEIEAFDRTFAALWHDEQRDTDGDAGEDEPALPAAADDEPPRAAAADTTGGPDATSGLDLGDEADDEADVVGAWSADELLRDRDFAAYGPDELRRARRLVARIAHASPTRDSLRLVRATRGPYLDSRRTLRRALRTDGIPFERSWRRAKRVPRRLVFLVDVSGSMEAYARPLTMFLQAAVASGRHVEAFTFGTRLTRLTPFLAGSDPDRALRRAARAVPDWAGGTRIGENIRAFNDVWGRRGLTRSSVVVIASDGWERGDPRLLASEVQRLRRAAYAVVWVNPLAGEPGYEPLVAGLVAALPHVDLFLPANNLRSLETLADVLTSLRGGRERRAVRRP